MHHPYTDEASLSLREAMPAARSEILPLFWAHWLLSLVLKQYEAPTERVQSAFSKMLILSSCFHLCSMTYLVDFQTFSIHKSWLLSLRQQFIRILSLLYFQSTTSDGSIWSFKISSPPQIRSKHFKPGREKISNRKHKINGQLEII